MDANEQARALHRKLWDVRGGEFESNNEAREHLLAAALRAAYERGVADERERAAKIAERTDIGCDEFGGRLQCHRTIAAAIRAGGPDGR